VVEAMGGEGWLCGLRSRIHRLDEDGDAGVGDGFVDAVNCGGEEVTGAAGVGDCG